MADDKLDWALPVMRTGYAGRGMTYVVVAGISLFAIWQGGQAVGTGEALASLERSSWGLVLLSAIGVGLICYMGWRLLDAALDLEDYGTDGKGLIARIGMVVTGLVHGALGAVAIGLAANGQSSGGGDEGSGIAKATEAVMSAPFGVFLVGFAGLCTIGAGIYYLHKAWKQTYLEKLMANEFTRNWNGALRAGVAAQGVVVTIVGVFLTYAALTANPNEAGGLGETFAWLSEQAYGRILVTALCLGLLGFALFLFVNAAYRIVPRLKDPDMTSLAQALR